MLPNTYCYNSVMDCWARASFPERAEAVYLTMCDDYNNGNDNAKPERVTFNSTLSKSYGFLAPSVMLQLTFCSMISSFEGLGIFKSATSTRTVGRNIEANARTRFVWLTEFKTRRSHLYDPRHVLRTLQTTRSPPTSPADCRKHGRNVQIRPYKRRAKHAYHNSIEEGLALLSRSQQT